MDLNKFGPRDLGIGIILISVLVLVISFYSISESLRREAERCELVCGEMEHEGCMHSEGLPSYVFVNFFLIIVLSGLGMFVYVTGEDWTGKKRIKVPPLAEDEKRVFEEIKKG